MHFRKNPDLKNGFRRFFYFRLTNFIKAVMSLFSARKTEDLALPTSCRLREFVKQILRIFVVLCDIRVAIFCKKDRGPSPV